MIYLDAEIRAILKQRAMAYEPCDGDLYVIQKAVWPDGYTDRDEVTVQAMLETATE